MTQSSRPDHAVSAEWSGLSWKWFRLRKAIRRRSPFTRRPPESVLFVMGCQRSGTTMLSQLFERDPRSRVYGEYSPLSAGDKEEGLRLDPIERVRRRIESDRVRLVVLKPIVESQNTPELLDGVPGARALWAFRHYRDVAASNLKKFGIDNGVRDLRPIAGNDPANWRNDGVSKETRALIRRFYSEEMKPYDAAVLFWCARNRVFLERRFDADPRIRMIRYEDLVVEPAAWLRRIYDFAGAAYPGDRIVSDVHARSVKKGEEIDLSPEVVSLAEETLRGMEEAYARQSARTA
ncbi:MAG: sulfotransferase [Candidatus Eisenbacteria bacterium]|nr:sulfotransferase [Candidatus Eisenbacteria bacterium]